MLACRPVCMHACMYGGMVVCICLRAMMNVCDSLLVVVDGYVRGRARDWWHVCLCVRLSLCVHRPIHMSMRMSVCASSSLHVYAYAPTHGAGYASALFYACRYDSRLAHMHAYI